MNREEEVQKNYVKPLNFARPIITPKFLVIGAVTAAVFLTFFYLYRELNVFISTPQLVISEPQDRSVIDSKTVRVRGVTERDAQLFINNQPVLVNQEGEFGEEINLQTGANTITIKAINRFNEESAQTISIDSTYQDENFQESISGAEDAKEEPEAPKLSLEISTEKDSSWVSVESDGNLVFSGTMEKNTKEQFDAKDKISVSAEKGNSVFVQIKGKEKKSLSDKKGTVKDVIFLAEKDQN